MTTMHALSWSFSSAQAIPCGKKARIDRNSRESLLLDSRRVLETGSAALDTFARINRGLHPSCNTAPSCPQRPLSPDSSNGTAERQNVGKSKSMEILRSNKRQNFTSKSRQVAPAVLFPALDDAETIHVSLPPSHAPRSVFLPSTPLRIPFPEWLRMGGEGVPTSITFVFRMALTCCVVAQWIKIAGALSIWASRLRLKFFDSPLVYRNSTKSSKFGRTGVFWDLENCPVPSGADVPSIVDKLNAIGNSFGPIRCFRAYGKLDYLARQALPFLNKDVQLCPVPDGKESADKAIILDATLFALDHKPCPADPEDESMHSDNDAVVVVTGDRGFATLLKELSKRKITTIVIGNAHQALPSVLKKSADFSLGWDDMMVEKDLGNGIKSVVWSPGKLESAEGDLARKISYDDSDDPESEIRRETPDVDCYQLDSSGSELLCSVSSDTTNPLVRELPKVLSDGLIEETGVDGLVSIDSKTAGDIGGRIRVLRHLRCEIAAIVERNYRKGKSLRLQEFLRLYEMEMGNVLVPGHYGFGGVKVLLQSMPDLVSLRPIGNNSELLEVLPFYPKGRNSYGKINYTREDLRCILYELLRTQWPFGVRKDSLSSEHLRITGRPLVLVTYEYLKTSDVFGGMRDILCMDSKTKHLRLVDGAQEPSGYSALARNQWS